MPEQPRTGQSIPGTPKREYPTPNPADVILTEYLQSTLLDYVALASGTANLDYNDHPNQVLVDELPVNWEVAARIYAKDREPMEDIYNWSESFDGESATHPEFSRDYVVRRSAYTAGTPARGATLTGITNVRVTNGGSGYSVARGAVTVTAPGTGGGSGFAGIALVRGDGVIVGILCTNEGSGYVQDQTLTITDSGGTGINGAATAYIQPTTAILVKEDLIRMDGSPLDSLYVLVRRLYQTVPGATISARRFLKTGHIAVTTRQRVLAATRPEGGALVTLDRVIPESTVTAIREIETTTNADGTAASANPTYIAEEIYEKQLCVGYRYEQDQPAATAATPEFGTTYGTGKIWVPSGNAILSAILVPAPGSGYTSPPTVTIAAPTGTPTVQATATATLKAVSVAIAASGSGYAAGDTVTASGGTGTSATFTLSGFTLATLAINAAGTGYDIDDEITLAGGTATTAGVVTVETVSLASVTPDDVGTGYFLGEVITFEGGTFATAAVGSVATLNVADTPTVNAAGTGYVVGDTMNLDGGTSTTEATATVAYTKLVSITGAGGSGYVPGDDIYCLGGTFSEQAVLDVTTTKVTAVGIAVGGTGGAPGPQTATGTTGTGTPFQVAVTVSAGGVITATGAISVAGSYTVNPTNIASEPVTVTGGGLADARLSLSMGVNAVTVTNGGKYLVNSATLTQYPYLGSTGTGATFTSGVYGVHSIRFASFANRGNYTSVPTTFTSTTLTGAGTGATFNAVTAGVRTVTITTAGDYSETATELTGTSASGEDATFTPSWGVLTFTITTAGLYTVTSASFTQASTTGSGTGATFQSATYTAVLTIANAGDYTSVPSNPVSTTTNGAGTLMTLTITWGVASPLTITNAGQGYWIDQPLVTFSGGGGGSGARAVAYLSASAWRSATAKIIDGGMEEKQGTTLKTVWWLTAPAPPTRREFPRVDYTFPALYTLTIGFGRVPFRLKPGVNFTFEDHRAVRDHGARLTVQSQFGKWTDIRPTFQVVTPGVQSQYYTNIQNNTIHNALKVYETDENDVWQLVEDTPASTPATYTKGDILLIGEWQEKLWGADNEGATWQKFTLEIAEGYVVGLNGTGRSLPYFGNNYSVTTP